MQHLLLVVMPATEVMAEVEAGLMAVEPVVDMEVPSVVVAMEALSVVVAAALPVASFRPQFRPDTQLTSDKWIYHKSRSNPRLFWSTLESYR